MSQPSATQFPDEAFLQGLLQRTREKFERHNGTTEQLLMYSGGVLNWVADYVTDVNVRWTKEEIEIDSLYLTGMGPAENVFVITQADRSAAKFRALLESDAEAQRVFAGITYDPAPILLRREEGNLKVLDGMHRVVGAIKKGKTVITAFVAHLAQQPQPQCEPHVVYDILRAYERQGYQHEAEAVAALRFLRRSYANVDSLLRERFNGGWQTNAEVAKVITLALETS